MTFNYAKELKQWTVWKEKEESLLRALNVDEKIIQQIREYDWEVFKAGRRIMSRQYVTHDNFFIGIPYYDKKDILSLSDLLDEIDDLALYSYLQRLDQGTLTIILLKILGYSTKEIAHILHLSCSAIYNRIDRLKRNLRKFAISEKK